MDGPSFYNGQVGKGPFLYYVRVKGWVGGIGKYLLFLTGVGGGVLDHPYVRKKEKVY